MAVSLRSLPAGDLPRLKPLWEKLNRIHLEETRHFREHYLRFTFEQRCVPLEALPPEDLRIEAAEDRGTLVGYCIASLKDGVGEIESLFLEEGYRGQGLGRALAQAGLGWLRSRSPRKIVVSVAEGHESVLPFYQGLGFAPRMTTLQWKG